MQNSMLNGYAIILSQEFIQSSPRSDPTEFNLNKMGKIYILSTQGVTDQPVTAISVCCVTQVAIERSTTCRQFSIDLWCFGNCFLYKVL